MASTKYLTQFICTCNLCDRETVAIEVDGEITVDCGVCANGRSFSRPSRRLTASVMAIRLEGHFKVDARYG